MKRPSLSPRFAPLRLLRTSAVRLALRYVLIYATVLGLASGAVLWHGRQQVDPALEAELESDLSELVGEYEHGGMGALAAALQVRLELPEIRLYLLLSPERKMLAGNLLGRPNEDALPADGTVHMVWIDEEDLPRGLFDDDAYLPFAAARLGDGARLFVGRGIEQVSSLQEFAEFLTEGLGMAILLALIISITLGRAILRRMDAIGRTAGEIMAGDLSQRVPVGSRNDEFDALAQRLNAMLDRVQQLVRGMREVTDNVAHDLRSPLTRLRNRLEVTLLEPRSEEEYRETIRRGIEDADALIRTFNALLGIAQAEAGNHRTQWGPVNLNTIVSDLEDLYRPLAEEKGQTLEFIRDGDREISGSRHLIAQALGNLIENAIKYSPEGGRVRLEVRPSDTEISVIVSDDGPGIPAADRARVLERFVRLERSRHTPGNGLGLSLVKAVCKLHKAKLELGDANPGLQVTLRFPLRPDGPA